MPMMPNWFHPYGARRPAEDQRHYPLDESSGQKFKCATFTAQTLHDLPALMSEKLSSGNKNHGSCVSNDTGPVSRRRPSAAWDIWDKVWRAKKNVFDRGGITWL